MSIEQQPSAKKGNEEDLKSYVLNGQEVQLTAEQASALDAQPIGHGGDLGLEKPAEGAIPITGEISADDIAPIAPFNQKDKAQAREVQRKLGTREQGFWTRKKMVAAGAVAAVATGVVGVVAAGALGGSDNEAPNNSNDTHNSGMPFGVDTNSEPWTIESLTPEVSKLEIGVEQNPGGEQPVRGFAENTSDWMMAGATPEIVDTDEFYAMSIDEYVDFIAEPIDEAYIKAMFVDGWKNNENLRTYIEGIKSDHRIFLKGYIATVLSKDAEPYQYYSSVTSVSVEFASSEQMISSYSYVDHDNFNENNAHKYIAESQEGVTGGSTVTQVNQNGVWKAADVVYNPS